MTTSLVTPAFDEVATPDAWRARFRVLGANVPRPAETRPPVYRRILFLTMVGSSDLFAIREGLIAHALRMRGAEVIFLLCDGFPVCDARTFDNDEPDACTRCYLGGAESFEALGHSWIALASFVDTGRARALWERAMHCPPGDLLDFRYGGIPLGRYVYGSTLRYFRAPIFEWDRPEFVEQARRYLASALVMTEAARTAYRKLGPDKVFSNHPFYASWGPWAEMARAMRVPFDTHHGAHRRNTVMCHHDAPRTFRCDDLWESYRDRPLNASEERELDDYLETRETNSGDFNPYWDRVDPDVAALDRRLGVPERPWRRRVCAFANVAWDAVEFESRGAFPHMLQWVDELIEHFRGRPDDLLLLKAHPAETKLAESTPERWRILERYGDRLPDNVVIIPPEDNVGTFSLYRSIAFGLVHTSTVGLEMALAGVPVLTTGAGVHYEQEGIVRRASTREEYFRLLDGALDDGPDFAPDPAIARRYAYTFFFRKTIPFDLIDVRFWQAQGIRVDRLEDLRPGRFPGLDTICDGLLYGAPFDASTRSAP